ncbi:MULTISPECIES: helix-turn-helix domain-containing protein [Achromobacter]|uniref:Helix-turn-helix domain-containing protein n=2 Tax=Achromobacter spanius TaxID=217203 RepID=A0ABY8GTL9_9BURK|nr:MULTISPECIES: helix-turn-helix domain-containing protein [Achromobacter]WAI82560.1 helix-turn-helix domain-containing protein [Achromobacter spanius]WEX92646.1 helix-turn-helix domain-containing protein [Achromobacter sp. SS2-2022]WFP08201.1 helix-turn-helix domain-containing protein [Achromobacter spanius]
MSTIVMSACWPLQTKTPAQKAVLMSMADNANDEGVCWPSVAYIVMRTCAGERTVQDAIKWLIKYGAISVSRRTGRSTVYTITPAKFAPPQDSHPREIRTPARFAPPHDLHPREFRTPANPAPPPPQDSHLRGANAAPRTVIEPKEEPSLKDSPRPPEGASGRGRKKNAVSFKTFVDACQANGEKVIGDYQPVLDYCEQAKLPAEFVNLCWAEFKRRHLPGGTAEGKRYTDWRRAFLNCVQGNWYGIWFADKATGAFALTTKGVQAENVVKGAEQ